MALGFGQPVHSPIVQLAILPGTLSPAIAAFIVRKWITREGFADAGLNPVLTRWRYYLVAWLLPLLVVTNIIILAIVLGILGPDLTVTFFTTLAIQLTVGAFLAMFVLLGEEFGWRGYLQLRLCPRNPLIAAVATGIIWTLWHYLPINFSGHSFSDQSVLGMLVFTITSILLSIIFGWLRVKTGSIWAPSLAYAVTNTVGKSLSFSLYGGDPNWIFLSYFGIFAWLPLGTLCVWIILTNQLRADDSEMPA